MKRQGKLNEAIQSKVPASSRCRLVVPFYMQTLKTIFNDRIANKFPLNVTECLTSEFDNVETLDHIMKADIIEWSSLFNSSERITQLKELNDQGNEANIKISVKCKVGEIYTNIFNKSLEDFQHDYCMTKYVVDNQLVELENVDMNPHSIDLGIFNCTNIINAERGKTEGEFSDRISVTETHQKSLDCAMNEFRSVKMFDWKVALTVLNNLNKPKELEDELYSRVIRKIENFLSLSTSACFL